MPQKSSPGKRLSRQEQRDLDLEIEFFEGVVRRDPDYVDALQILGDNYTRRGRFGESLKIDEQLVRLRPADALAHYNLACSYSLLSHYESASAALGKAIDLGYRDFKWLAKDPDLAKFRKHSLYRKIRARIKAMAVKIR